MFLDLYKSNLNGFKERGGGQFIALCPFHNDSKHSFSGNSDTGLSYCFTCGFKGNGYGFAKAKGLSQPHQYIVDDSVNYTTPPIQFNVMSEAELNEKMNEYKDNLAKNMSVWPDKIWDKRLINEFGIGIDKNKVWAFGFYNSENELVGGKNHRKGTFGYGKCQWYPSSQIPSYSFDKPLYICEGEKDVITLCSNNRQAITGTTGAKALPRDKDGNYDIEFIGKWRNTIYMCYDNDETGYEHNREKGYLLKKAHPHLEIKIINWSNDLPKGYDVYDAFEDDKANEYFFNGLLDGEDIELREEDKEQIKEEVKKEVFQALNINEFLKKKYPPTEPIIENFCYRNHISILGGDTGCMKSWVANQMALSVATGVPLFNYFKTTPNRVMLIQFENENSDMQKRFNMQMDYFNKNAQVPNWEDNFLYCPKQDGGLMFLDKWPIIDATLDKYDFTDGLLIVDNLYTSTEKEIQNNQECTHLIREIDRVRQKYSLSMELIAHTNKVDNNTKSLRLNDIQGGKTITSQFGYVTMMGKSSTSRDVKIMKMIKCRSDENPLEEIAFKLKWKDGIFFKGSERWEVKVAKFIREQPEIEHSETFNRDMLSRNLPEEYDDMGSTKMTRLIDTLIAFNFVIKIGHNNYKINRQEIDDWD